MKRAHFERTEDGSSVTYHVTTAGTPTSVWVGMVALSPFAYVIILAMIMPVFNIFIRSQPALFIISSMPTLYFSFRIMRHLKKKFHPQSPSVITITPDMLKVTRGSILDKSIAHSDVRRLRMGNTAQGNGGTSIVFGSGFHAATLAATSELNAARAKTAFALFVDHGNAETILAHDLDELTARNLLQDMGTDLKLR